MRFDKSKPLHQHLNSIKPPKLPIDILQRILKPENLTMKQSLGVPRVCREWYMLGQRLIWQEMTVSVGNPAITYPQQEAFLDQPKFRSFCTSLSVIFDLRSMTSTFQTTNPPVVRFSSEVLRLRKIMDRLSPLENFGINLISADVMDLDNRSKFERFLFETLGLGHPLTHCSIVHKQLRREDLNVLLKCSTLKYLKIESKSDFPVSLDLDPVKAPLHTLFVTEIFRAVSNITTDVVAVTSSSLRSIILAGSTSGTVEILRSLTPYIFNLERFELQFADTVFLTQMRINNILTHFNYIILDAPKLKEINFGPLLYHDFLLLTLAPTLPDLEYWKNDLFWNTVKKRKELKIVVRFDPSKEQSGIPFIARQQLESIAKENGNEIGIHMIGQTSLFPFSQP